MTTSLYLSFPTDKSEEQFVAPAFLGGWKDIANYLGKGVRTVQRYERQLGLPVRRPTGKFRGSVLASRLELDQWVSGSPTRPDEAPLNSRLVKDLKTGISGAHGLSTDEQGSTGSISMGGTALVPVKKSLQTLSAPEFARRMETHQAIALEQRVRAREMSDQARQMLDRAIKMGKTLHPIFHLESKARSS